MVGVPLSPSLAQSEGGVPVLPQELVAEAKSRDGGSTVTTVESVVGTIWPAVQSPERVTCPAGLSPESSGYPAGPTVVG